VYSSKRPTGSHRDLDLRRRILRNEECDRGIDRSTLHAMVSRCEGNAREYGVWRQHVGVVQNATISESLLKKKHVAISYNKTREAAAAGIAHPIKTGGVDNFADVLTKAQTLKCFSTLVEGFMHG
jgi:hypothetical protein